MNCIILLLLLFCGGNSCSNGCSCIGSSRRWQVLRNIVFMRVVGIVGKCEKAEKRVGN